jgi:RNA polymerase sigma-70 factor (ECF subfamily)
MSLAVVPRPGPDILAPCVRTAAADMDPSAQDAVVARIRAGEREAYRLLIEALEPQVRAFVAARASSRDQVDEVVQAAFVAAFLKLDRYQPGGSFAAWLTGFARNLLRESHAARARQAGRDGVEGLDGLLAATAIDHEADDLEVMSAHARACLEGLAPHARDIAERRLIHGESLERIAEQHTKTTAAIATMLTRIKAGLRRCIEQRAKEAPHG